MTTKDFNTPADLGDTKAINEMSMNEFTELVYTKLELEAGSVLPINEPEEIEGFLTEDGLSRRAAMVFLARNWGETRDIAW